MERIRKTNMESLRGQEHIWQLIFGFVDSMALKCAVELRIADIIHSHGKPITLPQIASGIQTYFNSSTYPDISYLSRIMRCLVGKNIFTEHQNDQDEKMTLYGLNESSRWLLWDSKASLAPMVMLGNHPLQMAPWNYLSECVRDGGIAFQKAHGCEVWDLTSANPEFNKLLRDAMACTAPMVMEAVLWGYEDGFGCIEGTMVDVGGGTGGVIAEIVKSHPHIKGINFDLPQVIAAAPLLHGVTHVGGDMFDSIPTANTIFLKWVLHDWSDEGCVKILKNCRKAIADKKNGKIIIVEIVLEPKGNQTFDETRMAFDLAMMASTTGGKERTEAEWNNLLNEAGFHRYKITKIPTIPSIIEAFPL